MMHQSNKSEWQKQPVKIGDLLVAESKLTAEQAIEAAAFGRERGLLFSEAAILLGMVSVEQLDDLLARNRPIMPPAGSATVTDDLFALKAPLSPRTADLRRVAQTLAMQWFMGDDKRSALTVISADRHEGRTAVAANLACIFAKAGVPTLLIEADLHHPSIQTKFGLAPGDASPSGHYAVRGVENLSVIPATALLDLHYDRFMQFALQGLIEANSVQFKAIFVDTAAAETSNDYQMAALAAGGAMVVTREGATRARRSARMLDRCDDAGIPVVGGVMLKS
ncbi:MAG: hypothetical protein ABW184_15545 [Sphingobium sp.]